MIRIAINGLGRIGRNFLRVVLQDKQALQEIKVVAINIGPAAMDTLAHMFKYDTLMGTYQGSVRMSKDTLHIDDHEIKILSECDPLNINWSDYNIDWVVESSGRFTKREDAHKHIDSGASAVLITAPAKDEDVTIIPGVNDNQFDKKKHKLVSLGSCTTNAFLPVLKVLHDAFEIQQGFMTTVHAYTNTQVLLDVNNSDLRRSRAAALNIIPTTTGAAKVMGKIIPELETRVKAVAMRVPVAKVSLLDLSFVAAQNLSIEKIHNAFHQAATGSMKNIVAVTTEPLVSSDFCGTNYSVIIDGLLTDAVGTMGKIFGWYDNEWAYSVRLKDFLISTI